MRYIAYGIGREYRKRKAFLEAKGVSLDGVADIRFADSEERSYDGDLPIIPFSTLKQMEDTILIVFPCGEECIDFAQQEFSSESKNVLVLPVGFFLNPNLDLDRMYSLGASVALQNGMAIQDGSFYFIVRYGYGDFVFALPYILMVKEVHAHPERYNIEEDMWNTSQRKVDRIVIVTDLRMTNAFQWILRERTEFVTLTKVELDALDFWAKNCSFASNIFPDWDFVYSVRCPLWSNSNRIWYSMYDIPMNNVAIEEQLSRFKLYTYRKEDEDMAAAIMQTYGMIQNKTVILCPRANSITMLNVEFWEKLAKELVLCGYKVFTNAPTGETTVAGTIGLSVSVQEICTLRSQRIWFIGIQCGLMDVLSLFPAACRLFILFPVVRRGDKQFLNYKMFGRLRGQDVEKRETNDAVYLLCGEDNVSGEASNLFVQCMEAFRNEAEK